MIVRLTKSLQSALSIKELPEQVNTHDPGFLQEWYMTLTNIKSHWFFLFVESKTCYTLVRKAEAINNIDGFARYMEAILSSVLKDFLSRFGISGLTMNALSLRSTENNRTRRVMVMLNRVLRGLKFKNDYAVFEILNDLPQKNLYDKTAREAFDEEINELLCEIENPHQFNLDHWVNPFGKH